MNLLIAIPIWIVYLVFQSTSIYGGDSGELVAASFTGGIAHPPGYPLYMLLGNLIGRIPWGNVAWRFGLLSSLPTALSLIFLGKTATLLTKRTVIGSLAIVTAAFLYPNWLYAIVPEVFGLYALFSSVLVYLAVRFLQTKNVRDFFWMSFIAGLSLTHQHMIAILLMVIGIACFSLSRKVWLSHRLRWWVAPVLFVIGFLPYLYAPIVSVHNPVYDWEHPADPLGFIRLVTRASYGPFRASYTTGESMTDRLLGLATVFHFTREDFGWIGVAMIALGVSTVFVLLKPYYSLLLGYTGAIIAFFFYAGFPVHSDFSLGTLERFMIVLYQQFALLYAIGLFGAHGIISRAWKKFSFRRESMALLSLTIVGIAFLLPIRLLRMNYRRLWSVRSDRTMEHLADDLLRSVPENAIVSLDTDTAINAVSYAHYVLGKRRDIIFMSFPLLQYPIYRRQLKSRFPRLTIPESPPDSGETYLANFIRVNAAAFPIIAGRLITDIPEHWVPQGLVMQYYPSQTDIPDRNRVLEDNLALFSTFIDPTAYQQGKYRHLLLSDVIAVYDDRRLILAQALALQNRYQEAKEQVLRVMADYPRTARYYSIFINLLLDRERCEDAIDILSHLQTRPLEADDSLPLFYETYKTCHPQSDQFKAYESIYRANQERFDALLQ